MLILVSSVQTRTARPGSACDVFLNPCLYIRPFLYKTSIVFCLKTRHFVRPFMLIQPLILILVSSGQKRTAADSGNTSLRCRRSGPLILWWTMPGPSNYLITKFMFSNVLHVSYILSPYFEISHINIQENALFSRQEIPLPRSREYPLQQQLNLHFRSGWNLTSRHRRSTRIEPWWSSQRCSPHSALIHETRALHHFEHQGVEMADAPTAPRH